MQKLRILAKHCGQQHLSAAGRNHVHLQNGEAQHGFTFQSATNRSSVEFSARAQRRLQERGAKRALQCTAWKNLSSSGCNLKFVRLNFWLTYPVSFSLLVPQVRVHG